METSAHLNYPHNVILPVFGKKDFKQEKQISIKNLYANQKEIDLKVLNIKLTGKNHSICFVVKCEDKLIIIDGHHTVIAKKLNGQKRFKAKYLDLDNQPF